MLITSQKTDFGFLEIVMMPSYCIRVVLVVAFVVVLIQNGSNGAFLDSLRRLSTCFGGPTGDEDSCNELPLTIEQSTSAFKDINTYLMQSVKSNDFEVNIEKAFQLLNNEVHYRKKGSSNRKSLAAKPGSNADVEVLIKSLILFVELDKVNQPGQCTMKVTQILSDNNKSAANAIERKLLSNDGTKSRESKEAQLNLVRVDEIIFEAARRRAEFCYPTYEQRWFKLRKSLRRDRRYLRSYFDMVLKKKLKLKSGDYMKEGIKSLELLFETCLEEIVEYIRDDHNLKDILAAEEFSKTLEFLRQTHRIRISNNSFDPAKEGNEDRKMPQLSLLEHAYSKTDKWLALFAIHLIKPCEKMATLLGSIYESYEFDAKLVNYISLPDINDDEEQGLRFSIEFYEDMIYYKMCRKLMDEKRTFFDMLSEFDKFQELEAPLGVK